MVVHCVFDGKDKDKDTMIRCWQLLAGVGFDRNAAQNIISKTVCDVCIGGVRST